MTTTDGRGGSGAGTAALDPVYERVLTRRERDVVRRLLAGDSTREIAENIGLSPVTVVTYLKRLGRKLGVHGRVELLARVTGKEPIHELVLAVPLTVRERDVVGSLLAGATPQQIADDTGLTVATVRTYVKRVCKKLGVCGRIELLARVRHAGRDATSGN